MAMEERFLKLEAEVIALRALLRALTESHQAPQVLRHNFERVSETALASLLATGLPESLIDQTKARIESDRRSLQRICDRADGKARPG
jgi:hypothetical protein